MYPVKGRRSVFAVVIVLTVIFLVFHKQRSSHSYWSAFYKTGTRPFYGYEEAHPATSYTAIPDDFTLEEYPIDEAYEKAKGIFVEVATNVTTERFSPNGGFGIVGDSWDSSHLRALCEKTKVWEGSVVFECSDLTGSVVDVRQALLTCLRYAIEAGAGLMVPQIITRGYGQTTVSTGIRVGFEYYFDESTFFRRLSAACPNLHIYQSVNDVEEQLGRVTNTILSPKELQTGTDKVISLNADISRIRAPLGYVTLVAFVATWGYYPVCRDGAEFVSTFSGILPIRQDVSRLAATVLYEMKHRFDLEIDPWVGITKHAYLGTHFRISPPDAVVQISNNKQAQPAPLSTLSSPWPKYEELSSHILSLAVKASLPVIYVASGSASSNSHLADDAFALSTSIPVLTKNDLLSPQDRQTLWKLSWDQQAAVDYLVLLKSSYFAGVGVSGFSWDMATRRMGKAKSVCASVGSGDDREMVENEGGAGSRMDFGGRPFMPEGVVWKDEYSDLIGDGKSEFEGTMWP